jgi:beta-1,4-mannooligosaccharide/beta-1,4-mannosyl-N-acetylglucosamine phosphorylase
MLLDLEDPTKIIGVLDKPILTPNEDYEIYGRAENVTFACGAIVNEEKDEIRIYYGAADERIALATGSLSELLSELKKNPPELLDAYKK